MKTEKRLRWHKSHGAIWYFVKTWISPVSTWIFFSVVSPSEFRRFQLETFFLSFHRVYHQVHIHPLHLRSKPRQSERHISRRFCSKMGMSNKHLNGFLITFSFFNFSFSVDFCSITFCCYVPKSDPTSECFGLRHHPPRRFFSTSRCRRNPRKTSQPVSPHTLP